MVGNVESIITNAGVDGGIDNQYAGYVQDKYQATRRLVFDLGLRYQVSPFWYGPPDRKTASGQLVPGVTQYIKGEQSKVYPNAPIGLVFPYMAAYGVGDPGVPRGLVYTKFDNICPRIGLAWDVFGDGKTSLRAGWGVFFASPEGQTMDYTAEELPQLYTVINNETTNLTNPVAANVTPASLVYRFIKL